MTHEQYLAIREDIMQWIAKRLKKGRFQHTLGVEQTAMALAQRYEIDTQMASLAALLHDNAKNMDMEQQLLLCQQYFPEIGLSSQYATVLHAFAGAAAAKQRYPQLPEELIEAIAYHTTGRAHMGTLEKIIYIADYIEPNRKSFAGLEKARKWAQKNLDRCMALILQQTNEYVMMNYKPVHPLSIEAAQYYHILSKQEMNLSESEKKEGKK